MMLYAFSCTYGPTAGRLATHLRPAEQHTCELRDPVALDGNVCCKSAQPLGHRQHEQEGKQPRGLDGHGLASPHDLQEDQSCSMSALRTWQVFSYCSLLAFIAYATV